jgi:hypothetical protein
MLTSNRSELTTHTISFILVNGHVIEAKEIQQIYADRNSKEDDFQVGDRVYLKHHRRTETLDKNLTKTKIILHLQRCGILKVYPMVRISVQGPEILTRELNFHIPHRYNMKGYFSHITNINVFGFKLQNVSCDVGKAHNVNIKSCIITLKLI